MSYQVLARKWRPRTFAELVGQEHVLKALVNALDNDRLHHAYLFTGTRGVGKTTIARILAKSLNCEQGISATPCGTCSACVEIGEGRFVDLIEVDAASRTKVEDTRELLENVQYRPTRGRYKVYLIDEVHMLSGHSFNALLKTLEEPPPHVKFLLATTDPQKLPVTILSRCLQFNLKHLGVERISGHLHNVLSAEDVPFEEAALLALARAADGSMRDALSLTDQAIAHGGGRVMEAEVTSMLGTINRREIQELCRALAARDAAAVLTTTARMAEFAPDYGQALGEMLAIWHRVAIGQQVPEAVDDTLGDRELVMQLANELAPEDVQLFYQIGLLGRRDLPYAADPRSGFEMVLLRQLAFQPQGVTPPAGPPPERRPDEPASTPDSTGTAGSVAAPSPVPASPGSYQTPAQEAAREAGQGTLQETVSQETPSPRRHQEIRASAPQPRDPLADEALTQRDTAQPAVSPSNGDDSVPAASTAPGSVSSRQSAMSAPVSVNAPGAASAEAGARPAARSRPRPDGLQRSSGTHAPRPDVSAAESAFDADPRDYASEDSYFSSVDDYFNGPPAQASHSAEPAMPEQAVVTAQPDTIAVDAERQSRDDSNPVTVPMESAEAAAETEATTTGRNRPSAAAAPGAASGDPWLDLFAQLQLGGILYNTASNLALVAREGDSWHFVIDGEQSALFEAEHQQRLAEVLTQHLGRPQEVVIEAGQLTAETPARRASRIREERRQHAVATLQQDPLVAELLARFSGRLLEQTVVPRGS